MILTRKRLELVEEAKRYHFDIVGVSSIKTYGSGTVDLDGGWKLFYFVLILMCLLKRVWGFSQAPGYQIVCQIEFRWDHGSAC